MSATCSSISSLRSVVVVGKFAIWSRARFNCSAASISAERSSDRCPALPHRHAAEAQASGPASG